tara:strand:- start:298 stop:813 length:516 start_codon:yes stop_codon:yes gene_type:complete
MVTALSKSLISTFPQDDVISEIYTGVICEAVYLDYSEDRERIYRKVEDTSKYYLLNYAFDNTENIHIPISSKVYRLNSDYRYLLEEVYPKDINLGDILVNSSFWKKYTSICIDKDIYGQAEYLMLKNKGVSVDSIKSIDEEESSHNITFYNDECVKSVFVDTLMIKNVVQE